MLISWGQFSDTLFPCLLPDINPRVGNVSIHDGLIGGVPMLIYYTRRDKLNFYQRPDLYMPGVAFGIIGNILNGTNTVERVTGWAVGYRWPDSVRAFCEGLCVPNPSPGGQLLQSCQQIGEQLLMTAPVYFKQLYGVFTGTLLSAATYFWLRSRKAGWALWQFWLLHSILRAGWAETLRFNPLTLKTYLSTLR